MKVWIGTSGYSYADWVGPFYPPGLRANRMLRYYSGHFPVVELNFTFYRLPTAAMLARLAEQTPLGFQFVAKLPKTLSHDEDPRDLGPFREAVAELHGRGQLHGPGLDGPTESQPEGRSRQRTRGSELLAPG